MTFDEYRIKYWRMYLALEKEFLRTLDYVDLSVDNLPTTSLMYAKQIISAGVEIDNVFRECTGLIGRSNIEYYYNSIIQKYPLIVNQTVKVNDTAFVLKPYDGWNGSQPSKSLIFWDKYNELKHDRILYSKNASMKVCLDILAGLFIIEFYRFNEIFGEDKDTFLNMPDGELESKLFILNNWDTRVRFSKTKIQYSIYDEDRGKYDFRVQE